MTKPNHDFQTETNKNDGRTSRKVQLTEMYIKSLQPNGKRTTHADGVCQGLTLRVGASGTKTFAFMARDAYGTNRTQTLGRYPTTSLKEARKQANTMRQLFIDKTQLAAMFTPQPRPEQIDLKKLLLEAESVFGDKMKKKTWLPRGKESNRSTARQVINCVFWSLMDRSLVTITIEDLAACVNNYRPKSGKFSANGQASKALAYLRPVFDWASHRGKRFQKIGAGRQPQLELPDLAKIHDPATSDPLITGVRDRILLPTELARILPELRVSPQGKSDWLDVDLRPIAHRFILLTLSRRAEIECARWKDIDFELKTWTKVVKSHEVERKVTHPLSEAAITLLRSLPGFAARRSDDLVFPNRNGGPLDNWPRSTTEIQRASKTSDWGRHDLRRTAATILEKLGVAIPLIDTLLSHSNAFSNANSSKAASAYIQIGKQLKGLPDPLRDAVNILAEVLQKIEEGVLD